MVCCPVCMSRLFFDHDSLNPIVIESLADRGFDVLRTSDVGLERASDAEVLAFAARESRTVYTANTRDYVALHYGTLSAGNSHAGIIVRTRQGLPAAAQLRAMAEMAERFPLQEDRRDQLLFLENFP